MMVDNGLCEPGAKAVARLFRDKVGEPEQHGLSKAEIGEFIAKNKDFNQAVRAEFIQTFDFTGMSFVKSLRVFLKTFRLPGESMLIERLFSTWAARFYHNNPGDFCRNQLTEQKIEKYRSTFDAMSAKTEQQSVATAAKDEKAAGCVCRSAAAPPCRRLCRNCCKIVHSEAPAPALLSLPPLPWAHFQQSTS